MEYYKLPQSDLTVSKIALGCMRISGKSVEEVEELVKTALDLGINFFDHADIYGGGKSEEVFGEVLKRHPEYRAKMILQTKCGIVPGKRYDFSKEHILQCVNDSLKRLNTDHVEILLLHRPDALCDPQEVAEAFAQDKDGGVLDYCRLNDITIQPWSSIQASWAEGTFIDHPDYQKLNDVMQEIANKYHVTKPTIAIAWLLRHPAKMQPIVGTTSPIHLKEISEACKIQLTRQEWYDLYLASDKPLP